VLTFLNIVYSWLEVAPANVLEENSCLLGFLPLDLIEEKTARIRVFWRAVSSYLTLIEQEHCLNHFPQPSYDEGLLSRLFQAAVRLAWGTTGICLMQIFSTHCRPRRDFYSSLLELVSYGFLASLSLFARFAFSPDFIRFFFFFFDRDIRFWCDRRLEKWSNRRRFFCPSRGD